MIILPAYTTSSGCDKAPDSLRFGRLFISATKGLEAALLQSSALQVTTEALFEGNRETILSLTLRVVTRCLQGQPV